MIEFEVFGTPAPQGSKKFVGTSKAGRGILVESSTKVKPWRMDVKAAAEKARDLIPSQLPMTGPLVCSMVFTLQKPKSAPKKQRTWPNRKPDLSKLIRSTEDAITDAGLWADDARVIEYRRTAKVYPGEDADALRTPGVKVRIWRADDVAWPAQSDLVDMLHGDVELPA